MKAFRLLLPACFLLVSLPLAAEDAETVVEQWLAQQAELKTWSAEVTQTRKLRSLARPIESQGKVYFAQPNRFRWQLGSPPRTIAVRTKGELLVAYPRLKQLERYPMSGDLDPSWRQVLALLEVGFPSDLKTFNAAYEVVSVEAIDTGWRLVLRPASKEARRLIEIVRLELSGEDFELLATELEFPDGSTMRNDFSAQRRNPDLDDSVFIIEDAESYDVVNPLEKQG